MTRPAPSKRQPSRRDGSLKHPLTRTRARIAQAKPTPARASQRLANRQKCLKIPGYRNGKPRETKCDTLKEWPAVAILEHRFVKRNRKLRKEYLIKWEQGEKGELFAPTWQPCENANGALRAEYENKNTDKVGALTNANAETRESTESVGFPTAGGDKSDVHHTDWSSLYVSVANTHPTRAAEDPQDTTHRSATNPTEEGRLASVRVTVASLLRSTESEPLMSPVTVRLQDIDPFQAKDKTAGRHILTAATAPDVGRETPVGAKKNVLSRPKGKLPTITRRYKRKSRSEDVYAVPLSP
ncbi:hypothetical protein Q7P37_009866 [Cladosporium fusiforme]